jgi:hypothetical protein
MAQTQPINPAFMFWDMWMTTQRNYLQMWQRAFMPRRDLMPFERAFERHSERYGTGDQAPRQQRVVETNGQSEQVIQMGEELLNVSTRRVIGATTRVRRVVREQPIERHIELHDESVVVEQQPTNGESADVESLVEREYVMSDSREVPVVTKQTRVRGNVVLRKQINNRVEVIRDVVRYADVEIEQPQRMPVVTQPQDVQVHQDVPPHEHHEAPSEPQEERAVEPHAEQNHPEQTHVEPAELRGAGFRSHEQDDKANRDEHREHGETHLVEHHEEHHEHRESRQEHSAQA